MKTITSLPLCIMLWASFLHPGISETYINRTRLIFTSHSLDESFTLINEGMKPALMQFWIDKDDAEKKPEHIQVPFIVLPPVSRLEPKSSLGIRVLYTGENLSRQANAESLFWLNVLEIPPEMSKEKASHTLQMAIRTRIKVFYRPPAIGKLTSREAITRLYFSHATENNKSLLRIENRSPLYITLTEVKYNDGRREDNLPDDGMIAPFSHINIPFAHFDKKENSAVRFRYIDDYGAVSKYHAASVK